MRFVAAIKSRWRISNFTVCLIGALLGLAAGLFFLRDFIFSSGIAVHYDLRWVYSSDLYPMYYLWDEFLQAPVLINHMMGYLLVYAFPPEVAEHLLYILIFTIMGLSMFFVTFKLTAPRHRTATIPLIASTLATVVFIVNPVVCMRVQHWFLLWYYAFLPLLLYFAYTAFRDVASSKGMEIVKKAIPIALILFLMSVSPRQPYYFPFLFLAFFAGFSRPWGDYLKKSAVLIVLTLVLYAVFSSLWLIPVALGSEATPPHYINTPAKVAAASVAHSSFLYNIFTLNSWWSGWGEQVFSLSGWLQSLWKVSVVVLPALAFAALLLRRSKLIIWLAIFALVFIFLGKGTNPPFGDFYMWLTFDCPLISSFGWQFRHPFMFTIPLAFCYAMLIGFTASHFLGWIRDKLNRDRLKRGLIAISIVVFVTVPLIAGYPLLSGSMSGTMVMKEVPSHWADFNRWMEEEGSDCKVTYYTSPPWFGSPKPAPTWFNYLEPSRVPTGQTFLLVYSLADLVHSQPVTMRYGELISTWNARYTVISDVRSDAPQINYALSAQEDMELVWQSGPLNVYEYQGNTSQIEACAHSVVVSGGVENILSLTAVDSYDLVDSSVVFLDQLVGNGDYLSGADILVSNQGRLDLCLSLVGDDYLIKPFATDWIEGGWLKGTAEEIYAAEWHFYLLTGGKEMENWQYDYGEGLVWHWSASAEPVDMTFAVDDSGSYDIVVRYFRSEFGGTIRVLLDGEFIGEIATTGQINEFVWQDLGAFDLPGGEHMLTLEHGGGFNAVNLFAVLPSVEVEGYEEQVSDLVTDKRIVHLWEGESALNYSGENVYREYRFGASNGEVLTLGEGSGAWRDVEILRDGDYRMAVSLEGSAVVSIDDQDFAVNSSELGFAYLDPLYLEEGSHRIEVNPVGGELGLDVVWLYSAGDGESVGDIFAREEGAAQVIEYRKLNPTKYRVTVNASQPFMLAFAEAHNSLWVAKVNGREYPSVPLNAVVNGFWIEDEGEVEVTIEFKSQRWFYYGAIISAVGIAAALAFLVWERRRKRRKSAVTK